MGAIFGSLASPEAGHDECLAQTINELQENR